MHDNRRRLSDIPEEERKKSKKIPFKVLFAVGKEDVMLMVFTLFVLLIHWAALSFYSSFNNIFTFNDIPLTFSYGDNPKDEIYTIHFGTKNKKVSYPLPLYYIYIKILNTICFGSKTLTLIISNIINVMTSTLAFRKIVKFGRLSHDVGFTTILYIFVPLRHIIFFFTPTIDVFFAALVNLTFLFDIAQQDIATFVMGSFACLTKPEGLFIIICLIFSNMFKRKPINLLVSCCLIIIFFIIDTLIFPNLRTIFVSPLPAQGYLDYKFLSFLRHQCRSIGNLRKIHGFTPLLGSLFVGGSLIIHKNIGLGIFSIIYTIYICFLVVPDPHRLALPAYSFSLLCGFNSVLTNKNVRLALLVVSPFIFLLEIYYFCAQVSSDQKYAKIWSSI